MWKYGGKTIQRRAFVDEWRRHSRIHPTGTSGLADEKAAAGLTEVTPETPPDSRLYTWGYAADGVTISKTAKKSDRCGLGGQVDGNAVLTMTVATRSCSGSLKVKGRS